MSNEYTLPLYEECEELTKTRPVTELGDPIERFILDNEPAGEDAANVFRNQLWHVIVHGQNVGALLAGLVKQDA